LCIPVCAVRPIPPSACVVLDPTADTVSAETTPVVEWVRFIDDDTGCPYFVSTVTGESTWDNPYGDSSDEVFVAPYDPDDPANATYWAVLGGEGSDVPMNAVVSGGKVSMSDYETEKQRTEDLSRELATLEAEVGIVRDFPHKVVTKRICACIVSIERSWAS
jgi:WW domain